MKSTMWKLLHSCVLLSLCSLSLISLHQAGFLPRGGATIEVTLSDSGLPHVLHQTWRNKKVATTFAPYIMSWKKFHPDWLYRFWTNKDVGTMVRGDFPELKSLFYKYPKDIQKADIMRYMLLYRYGGIYSDLDVESLRPLNNLTDRYPCILAQDLPLHFPRWPEGFVTNAIMACKPGHPFFRFVLDALPRYFRKHGKKVLWTTGPFMLEEVLREFLNKTDIPGRFNGVYLEEVQLFIAPWHMFLPTYDYRGKAAFQKLCYKKIEAFEEANGPVNTTNLPIPGLIQQCSHLMSTDWRNSPTEESYTDHHWVHTWDKKNIKKFRNFPSTVNVMTLTEHHIEAEDNITSMLINLNLK